MNHCAEKFVGEPAMGNKDYSDHEESTLFAASFGVVQLPMHYTRMLAVFAKPRHKFFRHENRAVLPARTANSNCKIAFAFILKTRQERLQQSG
jgi:hypothetical protein